MATAFKLLMIYWLQVVGKMEENINVESIMTQVSMDYDGAQPSVGQKDFLGEGIPLLGLEQQYKLARHLEVGS